MKAEDGYPAVLPDRSEAGRFYNVQYLGKQTDVVLSIVRS